MTSLRFAMILMNLAVLGGAAKAETKAERLDRLVRAYPQSLAGHDGNHVIWRDGTSMPVGDDIENKPFAGRLRKATILDQLSLHYPLGKSIPPELNVDPGRFR